MARVSRNQENHDNDGTSARTRPFTFEEIMLRRKNSKSSSEIEEEAGESGKLSVKDYAVTDSDRSELGEAYEEIKTIASDENEKISSTREQENASMEENQLDKKDNETFDAKSYLAEKLDKEVGNRTKEDKSEVGSRFSSRNVDVRADLENKPDKDIKSRVDGDKKEKHSHHRSRNVERLRDNLENEPDKVTGNEGKWDKNEKSSHCRIGNEEISRDDMEVESYKDIRNGAKGDRKQKQGHSRSRNEERARDVLENKPDEDIEGKAYVDKNEKDSHRRSRNEERSRDEYANDEDIDDGARTGKIEKRSHYRSRNKDRSRDDHEIESKENIQDTARGGKYEMGHPRSKTMDRPRDAFKNEADKDIKDRSKGVKNEKLNHGRNRTEELSRNDFETEADKNIKNRVKGHKSEKLSHHRSRNADRPRDGLKTEADEDVNDRVKLDLDKNEKSSHQKRCVEEGSRGSLENESGKDIQVESKGDRDEKESHYISRKEERRRDDLENKSDKYMKYKAEREKSEKSHPKSKNDEILRADFEVESAQKCSGRKEKSLGTEKRKSDPDSKRKQRPDGDEKDSSEVDGNAVKKLDSGKRYDLEAAGTKGRKESSPSHYDEERPKRRRSRTHEKKNQDRMSVSVSPRAHKRSSYQEREDESSRKSYYDADKNKMSSNSGYGSSHHHPHGGHGSRLGGYSPRKRRTDAAVKTPSPTARSPERKSAAWNFPLTGTDISSAGSMLSNLQKSHQILSSRVNEVPAALLVKSKSNPATKKAVPGASLSTLSASKNSTADNVQPASPRRRLCVENIPASASDKSVMECFNNFFLSSDAYQNQGTLRCIHCSMNGEKGQALVEFLTPEDATTALSFDGRLFSGSLLQVKRPKDFTESAIGVLQKPMAVVDEISDVVKDSPSKIFVGGIATVLSSDMVMEIASAFGALRGYHFKVNEACAFLEYVDKSITLKACAGLNGMKLGGEFLTVVQATPDASVIEGIEEPPCYAIPEHAKPLLSKATKVLKLHNVLNEEELSTLSGQEVEEVLEDVRLECARYGAVKSINIISNVNSSTTAPGEVINQASVTSTSPQIEDGCDMKVESTGIQVHPNSGESSRPVALGDVTLVDGAVAANSSPSSHVKNQEDNLDTIIRASHLGSDTISQESLPKTDTGKNQCLRTVISSGDFLMHNGTVVAEEELKPEEADLGLREASIKLTDTSIVNNEDTRSVDVFEVGCILVEYARTEASCIAAHCLHGRLYGDRIVVVGYADHGQYMSRFSK